MGHHGGALYARCLPDPDDRFVDVSFADLQNDPVGKAAVEIAVMGAAVYCWFSLGYPLVGTIFGLLALGSGLLNFRKENA